MPPPAPVRGYGVSSPIDVWSGALEALQPRLYHYEVMKSFDFVTQVNYCNAMKKIIMPTEVTISNRGN